MNRQVKDGMTVKRYQKFNETKNRYLVEIWDMGELVYQDDTDSIDLIKHLSESYGVECPNNL